MERLRDAIAYSAQDSAHRARGMLPNSTEAARSRPALPERSRDLVCDNARPLHHRASEVSGERARFWRESSVKGSGSTNARQGAGATDITRSAGAA